MNTRSVPGEIWLVRHGETEWSLSGKHTGSTDVPLTAKGEEEARALAPTLAAHTFARVLTSPMQRARRTAELAGFPDAEVDDDLHELDYGEYEGLTTAEIHEQRPNWYLWRDGCPGGEMPDQAGERADRVLSRLKQIDGDALIFGHGHFSRVLAARALRVPSLIGGMLILSAGSLSIIGSEHGYRAIRTWNTYPARMT